MDSVAPELLNELSHTKNAVFRNEPTEVLH